jgi:hypothetical protein
MTDIADIRETRTRLRQPANSIRTLVAEFRRALAAERLYEELKCKSGTERAREGIGAPNIARRVFDDLYS